MAQAPANVGHEEVAAAMNEAQAQPPVAEPVAPALPLQDDNVSFESFLRSSLCNFFCTWSTFGRLVLLSTK